MMISDEYLEVFQHCFEVYNMHMAHMCSTCVWPKSDDILELEFLCEIIVAQYTCR